MKDIYERIDIQLKRLKKNQIPFVFVTVGLDAEYLSKSISVASSIHPTHGQIFLLADVISSTLAEHVEKMEKIEKIKLEECFKHILDLLSEKPREGILQ